MAIHMAPKAGAARTVPKADKPKPRAPQAPKREDAIPKREAKAPVAHPHVIGPPPGTMARVHEIDVPRKGRPPSGKVPVTLRLDKDVLAALRSQGEGWQPATNALLRKALKLG